MDSDEDFGMSSEEDVLEDSDNDNESADGESIISVALAGLPYPPEFSR